MHRRGACTIHLAFTYLAVAACADSRGDGSDGSGGTSGTTAGTTGSTDSAGTDSTGGTVSGGTTGASGPNYDVGPGTAGDGGGMGTACQQAAATKSNQGCEFWAVDLPNAWQVNLSPAAEEQPFAIVVANTAGDPATVSVFAGAGATPLQTQTVAADDLYVFVFDDALGTENQDNSYGTAYRVESDLPVTAYQFNPLDNSAEVYSNDASLLFPTHVLDRDYTAITGDAMRLGSLGVHENAGAFVTVVALADATTVEYWPTQNVPVYPGPTMVTLDRGQTYSLLSNAVTQLLQYDPGQGNLSGTRLQASAPVAVFSGNVASFEPLPFAGCCADHLEHQMLPLSAWGTAYLVTAAPPAVGTDDDAVRVRLVGSFDGTTLTYKPAAPAGAPATIDAYQVAVFTASSSFSVEGSQPFAAASFLQGNEVVTPDPTPMDDTDDGWIPGDPAMILVPPLVQFREEYVFFVPAEYEGNWVTILRPSGAVVTLDGTDVSGAPGWETVATLGATTWERAHFALQTGVHRASTDATAGIGIVVVGYSPAVSFGYAGGSGVEFVNNPPVPPQG